MRCVISENGSAQSSCDVSGDESFLGSKRNVRVVRLRPMTKHSSVDNILSCSTDL